MFKNLFKIFLTVFVFVLLFNSQKTNKTFVYAEECNPQEEEICPDPEPEPAPEPQPQSKQKDNNTFHPDTRCHDATPPQVTWVNLDGKELTWSAIDGDKVEIRFSDDPDDLKWRFTTLNDGHETLGTMQNTGYMGGAIYYFEIRTVNGCKSGPWTNDLMACY